MPTVSATRQHDFSYGHRVHGHESKCAYLHGHNGRVTFTVVQEEGSLDGRDDLGRVMDFSVIKSRLCEWLEREWDHRFLIWDEDPMAESLAVLDSTVVWVPFNPTAENMAEYLVLVVGPMQLQGTGCRLVKCVFEETRKCSAAYELDTSME